MIMNTMKEQIINQSVGKFLEWPKCQYHSCQPLCFGYNDSAFAALITPLQLSNPELR